jgi:hypothetical protein
MSVESRNQGPPFPFFANFLQFYRKSALNVPSNCFFVNLSPIQQVFELSKITTHEPPKSAIFELASFLLECLVSLTIVFLFVGSLPPGINESHYLPKAKRMYDSTFASGNDIFLNSNDSHFLASTVAGSLAKYLELNELAWVCRAIAWSLLCIAWIMLCRALELPNLLRPLILLGWLLTVRYGHLAGEWIVGGYEAKAIAYPLAMFGMASLLVGRWNAAWVWLGAATAFHPVVGGWITVSVIAVWLLVDLTFDQRKSHMTGLAVAFILALIGAWPALMGLGSPDKEGLISAANVHTYFRLPHHMCPRTFGADRWAAAGLVFVAFALLAAISLRRLVRTSSTTRSNNLLSKLRGVLDSPIGKLVVIAQVSILISFCGWSIDQLGVLTGREGIAAKLLRFYWFRWSDIAVPLAVVVLAGWWLKQFCYSAAGNRINDLTTTGAVTLAGVTLAVGSLTYHHWRLEAETIVPPADRWMLRTEGPFRSNWDGAGDQASPLPNRFADWLAVCEWIQQNTPNDSLWITPKHQQTFKWYAQRAEVVSWKDVPQDNSSIIEWYRRIERLTQPRDTTGRVRSWKTEELVEIAREYQSNWILMDRTYQDVPPLFECKYPINIDNRSFAVFYISDAILKRTEPR